MSVLVLNTSGNGLSVMVVWKKWLLLFIRSRRTRFAHHLYTKIMLRPLVDFDSESFAEKLGAIKMVKLTADLSSIPTSVLATARVADRKKYYVRDPRISPHSVLFLVQEQALRHSRRRVPLVVGVRLPFRQQLGRIPCC
jgi:hypothetical protein